MKTTVEIKGYLITITESEEQINVTATKDDETIEEFTLDLNEDEEGETEETEETQDEIQDFEEFSKEEGEETQEETQKMPNEEETHEEENEGIKLKSFESFINSK